jgi:hypothetical protein
MAILIGIGAGLGVLFLWLAGHRFGLMLALISLAGVLGILSGLLIQPPYGVPLKWGGLFIGVALAWPVSGIPRSRQAWISFKQTKGERAEWARRRAELDNYIQSRRLSRS